MNRNGAFWGMIVAAATTAALLATVYLTALEVPRLTGRVSDHAGMISAPAKAVLEKKLAELERTDSTQIALLTVPDLQGVTIEEFSIKVAEQWKIGRKKLDNGVIFIVAKEERKMRIEVGYGLEGRLTDLIAGRILDNEVRPSFKAGDFDGGFARGVDGIILAVRGEYKAEDSTRQASGGHSGGSSPDSTGYSVIIFLVLLMINMGLGGRGILLGTLSGGIMFPLVFMSLGPFTWISLFWYLVIGLIFGLVLSLIGRAMSKGGTGTGGGGGWSGSGRSFGGGGFSGGGGGSFSGGGGSFGGGGASSGW